jgi:hypothetical protein
MDNPLLARSLILCPYFDVSSSTPNVSQKKLLEIYNTSLVMTMVRWGDQIEPISEEESHILSACHLLNCDEGQGQ